MMNDEPGRKARPRSRTRSATIAAAYLFGSAMLVAGLYLPLWTASGLAFRYAFEAFNAWAVFFLAPFILVEWACGLAAGLLRAVGRYVSSRLAGSRMLVVISLPRRSGR